jgi:hypothetical protein
MRDLGAFFVLFVFFVFFVSIAFSIAASRPADLRAKPFCRKAAKQQRREEKLLKKSVTTEDTEHTDKGSF